MFSHDADSGIARINGECITSDQFDLEKLMRQTTIDANLAKLRANLEMDSDDEIWQSLLQNQALRQEAKKLGF